MHFTDLVKGALLHDIGKFAARAENTRSMKPREKGASWLAANDVPETISVFAELNTSKNPVNETLIVSEADNLSSGGPPGEEEDWEQQVPLMSVFSKISMQHEKERQVYNNCRGYYRLGIAGENLPFPAGFDEASKDCNAGSYQCLLASFEEEFKTLLPGLSIDALLMLLEKYTSCIPAETRLVEDKPESYPDVSLFDHLKTTAAISACLYRYFEETRPDFREKLLQEEIPDRTENRYMLVGGDFSGVQKFIYTISSKGALKTLRARSFFLELMTEHVITKILNRMGLSRTNIIYSGGGRFYILAPNTPRCRQVLEQAAAEINEYFYTEFDARLYLALEKVEFPGAAFIPEDNPGIDFARLWEKLVRRLQEAKKRKFIEKITGSPEDFWVPGEPEEHVCSVCRRDTSRVMPLHEKSKDEPVNVCSTCKMLFDLGNKLPRVNYIAVCASKPSNVFSFTVEKSHYVLCRDYSDIKSISPDIIYVLNSWSIKDYRLDGAVQLFTGNYAAYDDEYAFKSFDRIAKEATGADSIGILRMDVDHLGQVFTRGLPVNERTFSRLSTLSRSLNQFFKYYINDICSGSAGTPFRLSPGSGGRNVTIVYAGGDDLFLAGAWDDVTEMAFDINNCFRAYTGHNPDVTISGGVVVQGPKFPLYRLAEMAGEAEEKAKDNGRDSISLFYTPAPEYTQDGKPLFTGTFKWVEAGDFIENILQYAVDNLTREKSSKVSFDFSKAFMHRLAAVADIWRREGKLYLPRLAYVMAREGERVPGDKKDVWVKFRDSLYNLNYLASLKTAVTWMDLLSRRGTEDDRTE